MTSEIIEKAAQQGIKMAVVPIACLADIKEDIENLKQSNELNGFQKWITMEQYVLDVPEMAFPVKSIVVLVAPLAITRARFHEGGKTVEDIIEHCLIDPPAIVGKFVAEAGRHMEYVHWLPQKRLAVRAGLTEYGRNNITFAEGMGSFLRIFTFLSDLEPETYVWREVKDMDLCAGCLACVKNCPTGAILPDRFLIDNDKCLTHQNEWGTHAFPDWVPKSAHHRLTGCMKCQTVCPKNQQALAHIHDTVDFSEEETAFLLKTDKSCGAPEGLQEKFAALDFNLNFEGLPRNLRAMFDNAK